MPCLEHQCVVPEKNPSPPHGRSLEIPRGWGGGGLRLNFYEHKLEFPGGRGLQNKKPFVGAVWIINYFVELHNEAFC